MFLLTILRGHIYKLNSKWLLLCNLDQVFSFTTLNVFFDLIWGWIRESEIYVQNLLTKAIYNKFDLNKVLTVDHMPSSHLFLHYSNKYSTSSVRPYSLEAYNNDLLCEFLLLFRAKEKHVWRRLHIYN